MSVIKSERKESKLEVLSKCFNLVQYTLGICCNEKYFPKRSRWLLSGDVAKESKEAFRCIRMANSIRVETNKEYEMRHALQLEAYGHLETLLSFIEIAYKQYHIPSRKIEYWTGLTLEVENYLQKWKLSDKLSDKL